MDCLTPGAVFLSRGFLTLLFPCTIIAGARFILDKEFGIFIPTWVIVTGTCLGIPIVMLVSVVWDEIHQRRRAAALGARLVPRVKGRWIGNIDVLFDQVDKTRNSFLGMGGGHLF